jgi:hypothetical protein
MRNFLHHRNKFSPWEKESFSVTERNFLPGRKLFFPCRNLYFFPSFEKAPCKAAIAAIVASERTAGPMIFRQ